MATSTAFGCPLRTVSSLLAKMELDRKLDSYQRVPPLSPKAALSNRHRRQLRLQCSGIEMTASIASIGVCISRLELPWPLSGRLGGCCSINSRILFLICEIAKEMTLGTLAKLAQTVGDWLAWDINDGRTTTSPAQTLLVCAVLRRMTGGLVPNDCLPTYWGSKRSGAWLSNKQQLNNYPSPEDAFGLS